MLRRYDVDLDAACELACQDGDLTPLVQKVRRWWFEADAWRDVPVPRWCPAPPWTVTFPGIELAAAGQTGENRDRRNSGYAAPAEGWPAHSSIETMYPIRGRNR